MTVEAQTSLGCVDPKAADFSLIDFTVRNAADDGIILLGGDGSTWHFDMTTAEPDITARELLQIMGITLRIPDGLMDRIKADPRVLRHFRRMP